MRALVFERFGEPVEVLSVKKVERPHPGEGELVVQVEAATYNPADEMFIRGVYRIRPRLPQVAGLDGAGIVIRTGPGARLKAGARVYFRHPGAWAEEVCVPESAVHLLPEPISFEKGTQLALNLPTAWALLEIASERINNGPDGWIAVTAPRSAIARTVFKLARARNLKTLALARQPEVLEADRTVVYSDPVSLPTLVSDAIGKEGLSVGLDAVGGELATQILRSLREHGELVIYGLLAPEPLGVTAMDFIARSGRISGFGFDAWKRTLSEKSRTRMDRELTEALIREPGLVSLSEPMSLEKFLGLFQAGLRPEPGQKWMITRTTA